MISEGNNEHLIKNTSQEIVHIFQHSKNLRIVFVVVIFVRMIFILQRGNLYWGCISGILKNVPLIFLWRIHPFLALKGKATPTSWLRHGVCDLHLSSQHTVSRYRHWGLIGWVYISVHWKMAVAASSTTASHVTYN